MVLLASEREVAHSMDDRLMISVAVPTLNSAKTLEWTLLSLRQQVDCEVRIVVADSGSTDGTLDICHRLGIKTMYVEPGNMYRAINVAMSQFNTEWCTYLNSDDWVYTNSYARLIRQAKESHADIVYGACDYTDVHGRFLHSSTAPRPEQLPSLFKVGLFGFAQQATIFRRQVYTELSGFNEQYRFSADYDYFFRAILNDYSFVRLAGPSVSCFRLHETQLTNTMSEDMTQEIKQIRGEFAQATSPKDLGLIAKWRVRALPHQLVRHVRNSLLRS